MPQLFADATVELVVNPTSGRGRSPEAARAVHTRLSALGARVSTTATTGPRHAVEIARRVAPSADVIVAVGGDGTVREVAVGLGEHNARIAVGFVPMGNANVVAREHGIARAWPAALEQLVRGTPTPMDGARAGDDLFLAMVGVGVDADIVGRVDAWRRSPRGGRVYGLPFGGDLLYAAAFLSAIRAADSPRLTVTADGEDVAQGRRNVWIANTRTYAKGWSIAPDARCDDGVLDYHVGRRGGLWSSVAAFAAARARRRRTDGDSVYGRARRVTVRSERPFPWHADGDPQPATDRLDVEVVPAALRLIVPGEGSAARAR